MYSWSLIIVGMRINVFVLSSTYLCVYENQNDWNKKTHNWELWPLAKYLDIKLTRTLVKKLDFSVLWYDKTICLCRTTILSFYKQITLICPCRPLLLDHYYYSTYSWLFLLWTWLTKHVQNEWRRVWMNYRMVEILYNWFETKINYGKIFCLRNLLKTNWFWDKISLTKHPISLVKVI